MKNLTKITKTSYEGICSSLRRHATLPHLGSSIRNFVNCCCSSRENSSCRAEGCPCLPLIHCLLYCISKQLFIILLLSFYNWFYFAYRRYRCIHACKFNLKTAWLGAICRFFWQLFISYLLIYLCFLKLKYLRLYICIFNKYNQVRFASVWIYYALVYVFGCFIFPPEDLQLLWSESILSTIWNYSQSLFSFYSTEILRISKAKYAF